MPTSWFSDEHFRLGVGLAVGPALVVIFAVYAFLRWGQNWTRGGLSCPMSTECVEHSGIMKDIATIAQECRAIWLEIKDINARQMSLREKLPEQYVPRAELLGIQERLKNIDQKLDRYLELSVLKSVDVRHP